jgi:hypothetical protein
MNFDEALDLPKNAPIRLADGEMGVVVRWWSPDEIGVQVFGERDIRSVKVKDVVELGDGALIESFSCQE